MTTLGRAYIEIVADGSGFAASLRDEVEKQLDTELTGAAKSSGRKAGRAGGKSMGEGIKDAGPDIAKESEGLGKKAGEGLSKGAKDGVKKVDPDLFDRIKILKKMQALGEEVSRTLSKSALNESRRTGISVDFTKLNDDIERETKKAAHALIDGIQKEADKANFPLKLDWSHLERDALNAGKPIMTALAAGLVRERKTATRAIEDAGKEITKKAGKIGKDAGSSLGSSFRKGLAVLTFGLSEVSGIFTKAGKAVFKFASIAAGASFGIVALGEAILTLLPGILSLGASLVQLSGLLLGLPAALGPLILTFLAVKFAFAGFAKAATAVDGKAFEQATRNMGATAKQLATTLHELMPTFRSVQQAAQDAFSAQVLTNIRAVTAEVVGPLRSGFATLGKDLGVTATTLLSFISSATGLGLIGQWFDTANKAMRSANDGLTVLLTGFANLNTAVKPIVDGLVSSIGNLEKKFGAWLTQISASGKAAEWFQQALDVLGQLGRVAENVGKIFFAMWDASGGNAKVLLQTIELLTGHLALFLGTAAGQDALTALFSLIGQTADALGPVLKALGSSIGDIAKPVADLLTALAPGLTALASALGPLLAGVGQALLPLAGALSDAVVKAAPALAGLGDALVPLGDAFGGLLDSLAPLLPVLLDVVGALAKELAPVIAVIGPQLKPVAEAFGHLLETLIPFAVQAGPLIAQVLLPVLQQLSTAFLTLLPVIEALVPVLFADLKPAFDAIVQVLPALLPPFLKLIPVFLQLLPTVFQLAAALGPLVKVFADLLVQLLPIITPLLEMFIAFDGFVILNVIIPLIELLAKAVETSAMWFEQMVKWVSEAIGWITSIDWGGIGKAIGGAFSDAWKAVVDFFEGLGKFFADLPGNIASAFSSAGSGILDFFKALPGQVAVFLKNLFDSMLFTVGAEIALVVVLFTDLGPKALKALEQFTLDAIAWAIDLGVSIARWINQMITDMVASVFDFGVRAIADLKQFTKDAIIWVLDFKTSINDWIKRTVDELADNTRELPGKVLDSIKDLKPKVINFFTELWDDTKKLVGNLVDSVEAAIKGLPGKIGSALSGLETIVKAPLNGMGRVLYEIIGKLIEGFNSVIVKFNPSFKIDPPVWHDFNTGGIVPGTGSTDIIPAMLTPGEGILTKRTTARLGGARAIAALNRGLGVQSFSVGGIVDGIGDAASSGWAKAFGLGKELLKILTDPVGFLNDVEQAIPGFSTLTESTFGQELAKIPGSILGLMVTKLKSSVDGIKNLYDAAGNLISKAGDVIGGVASGVAGLFGGGGGGALDIGAGSDQLGKWINQAVSLTGVPASWASRLRVGILRESGGNPNAVNNTDINAILGHPSIGLMQTIGPTFEAYRLPSLPDNIYDPIANIVAGIRYIISRYGSIFNVQQFNPNLPPRGYSQGGFIAVPQLAQLHSNELVLPLSQPARTAQLLRDNVMSLPRGASIGTVTNGGASTVINAPITLTAPQSDPEHVAFKVSSQIARMATAGI